MKGISQIDLSTTTLTIVDEADRLFYGDTLVHGFPYINGDGYLLGLSATGLSDNLGELTHMYDTLSM